MNTHSRVSDARRETLAAHTALCGGDRTVVEAVFLAITTDEAVDILDRAGLREPVMTSLAGALDQRLKARAGEDMDIEAIFFSNKHGILGRTAKENQVTKTALITVGGFLGGQYERSKLSEPGFTHGYRVGSES